MFLQWGHTGYTHTEFDAGVPGTTFRNQGHALRLQATQKPFAIGDGHALDGVTVTVPPGFYQPIFSVRDISTKVTIWDGATLVMGGLTREEVKKVNDKVPFFGDIPLLGRLFRSKGESAQKRNLLIFVTANLVNTAHGHEITTDVRLAERAHGRFEGWTVQEITAEVGADQVDDFFQHSAELESWDDVTQRVVASLDAVVLDFASH